MVTGNMIPDMIMDGIKISCVAMPTLDELFAIQTEHHADAEAHHDEQQQEQKYAVRSAGTFASKRQVL